MTPERLQEWRTARGWSQSEAARRCHVGRNSWRMWETGERDAPKWLGLVLAAVAFGLPPYE